MSKWEEPIKIPTREACGQMLAQIGEKNEDIFVLEADISKSTRTCYFADKFPERFLNVGIAEQNLVNVGVGLASLGKKVYVSTYAVFASMRACEQLRTFACYPKNKITVLASHGGLTPGNDGPTHQAIEDMGIMRTLPNMSVMMPADATATKALLKESVHWEGPLYIRLTRDPVPTIYDESEKFKIGKGKIVREGSDISIVANGDMVYFSIKAADILKEKNISVRVVDMHTIKPLDEELVSDCAKKTGAIVTVEDHNMYNGLGSAIAEIIAEKHQVPFKRVAIKDIFAESGEYKELIKKYGLDAENIVKIVIETLNKKITKEKIPCEENLKISM